MTIFLIICIVTMFGCSTSREARKIGTSILLKPVRY
jgi:hypothetical protein